MKKLTTIIFALLFLNCNAQTINIKGRGTYRHYPQGAYFKDIDNFLNPFVGTWLYVNGSTSLKIKLLKKENESNGKYSEDIIIGGYEYIENGVLKANTLPELFPSSTFSSRYFITGNSYLYNNSYPPCSNCSFNEIRLNLTVRDVTSSYYRKLIIKREVVNSQEQIKINLDLGKTIYYKSIEPEPILNFALPSGDFTLIKQ